MINTGKEIRVLTVFLMCIALAACGGDPAAPGVTNPYTQDTSTEDSNTAETTLIDLGPTSSDSGPEVFVPAYPPCETNEDCESSFCVDYESGPSECTEVCITECPKGYMCKVLDAFGPDLTLVCVKDVSTPCKACEVNSDCGGSKDDCVEIGGAKHCAPTCKSYLECAQDHGCVDGHCIPDTESCICTSEVIGTTRTCELTTDVGTCFGVQTCTGPNGWENCTAPEASQEICDGIDNDCNGIADDGVVEGADCQIESAVTGTSCPGTKVCMGVQGYQCQGQKPELESCDGLDNDCDGEIDEGFTDTDLDKIADCQDPDMDGDGDLNESDCAPLDPAINHGAEEVCDGKDNNCILGADEGFLNTDADALADCVDEDDDNDGAVDAQDCKAKDATVFPGNKEICNGLDENCNNTVDEGFPDLDNDGIADCIDVDIDGDFDPNASDCAPMNPAIHANADEICDGLDNNCKNGADEGFSNTDGDALANCVDSDDDNDTIEDVEDNCPLDINPDQADSDSDGIGDVCDILEPGPLTKLVIVTAPQNLGEPVGAQTMVVGNSVALYAAGYDAQGLYLGEQPAYWAVDASLDKVPYGPSQSITFEAKTANTNGQVSAISTKAGVLGDSTGVFTVNYAPIEPGVLTSSLVYSDKSELITGSDQTTVYVELIDALGQPVETPFEVELSATLGMLVGPVISLGDGMYQQTLQSGTVPGAALITVKINGQQLEATILVEFIEVIDLVQKGVTKIDCTNYKQFENKDIMVTGGTITINTKGCGPISLGRLRVLNNAVLTHDGCSTKPNRMELKVTELQLDPGASIDVSGKGYSQGYSGPTGAADIAKSAGGSHGGQGTAMQSQIATYGSLSDPKLAGGGGGFGNFGVSGCGGGVVRILVVGEGKASINGLISADGDGSYQVDQSKSPTHGAGAGGSIYISAKKVLGSGTFSADGGTVAKSNCLGWSTCNAPSRHGGGGGRIAMVGYDLAVGSFAVPTLFDKIHAYGGWGPEGKYSAAGTVWIQSSTDLDGSLIVNNDGNDSTAQTLLPMVPEGTIIEVSKTAITDYGKFVAEKYATWQVNPNVFQGSPTTLVDDTVATVLNNDVNKLFFNPKDKIDNVANVGDTYRGFLRLASLEVRGKAHLNVVGDLLLIKGDIHSSAVPPTFNVNPGAKLSANIFEFPSAKSASITGDINAEIIFCADCD